MFPCFFKKHEKGHLEIKLVCVFCFIMFYQIRNKVYSLSNISIKISIILWSYVSLALNVEILHTDDIV